MRLAVERDTLERARESEGVALESLVATVWPEAYRLALGILRDRGLAEDAAQEACATVARSLPSLRSVHAFAAWCYKIIVTAALSTARHHPRLQSLEEVDPALEAGFDRTDSLDLHRALATLSPVARAFVLLHYYAGLKSSEIAYAAGVPSSTVRFHLMRARAALRRRLEGELRDASYDEVLTDVQ